MVQSSHFNDIGRMKQLSCCLVVVLAVLLQLHSGIASRRIVSFTKRQRRNINLQRQPYISTTTSRQSPSNRILDAIARRGGASSDDDVEDETELQQQQKPPQSVIQKILNGFVSLLWTILSAILKLFSSNTTSSSSDIGARLKELNIVTDIPDCLQTTDSLTQALAAAKREGRFLVALTCQSFSNDSIATACIRALLSDEVVKLAERKSARVSPNGSFLLWIGEDPSNYSAGTLQVLASSKKVLGQSALTANTSERLPRYLSDIRKRNRSLLLRLAKRRQEQLWADERRENYSRSVSSDDQKRAQRKQAAKEAAEQAAQEAARHQAILERRLTLKENLPDEVKDGILVALRFPDGSTSKRRFAKTEAITTIFNWVDADFEHEREKVSLQTLNGAQTLEFDEESEQALSESAGGKSSIAFRVLLQ